MRCLIAGPHTKLASRLGAIIVFTEIYQITGPLQRLCRLIAGEGYLTICPESYHEYEAQGVALTYDDKGTDRGNILKVTKPLENYDRDAECMIDYLIARKDCNGRIGTVGMCLGGHLSFRCAFSSRVSAAVCFFPTDIHSCSLGLGKNDDSLKRCKDIKGELLMIFGRQDPHVPIEGRRRIKQALEDNSLNFAWVELNAEHAFIRDEFSKGRYNPQITRICLDMMFELFQRQIQLGIAKL
jgi:carboxymethylenebutenolidase